MASGASSLLAQTDDRAAARGGHRRRRRRCSVFAFAVSILTGLVFGLVPAIQATRFDIREALNEEGRGSGSGGVKHHRLRATLVVAEVAVALVLLIGAGLLLRSFAALQRVETGFDRRGCS